MSHIEHRDGNPRNLDAANARLVRDDQTAERVRRAVDRLVGGLNAIHVYNTKTREAAENRAHLAHLEREAETTRLLVDQLESRVAVGPSPWHAERLAEARRTLGEVEEDLAEYQVAVAEGKDDIRHLDGKGLSDLGFLREAVVSAVTGGSLESTDSKR